MKNKENKEKRNRRWSGLYFLGFVIVLYIVLFFLNPKNTSDSFKASGSILIKLIPVLFFVVFLMGLLNYFLKPKTVSRYMGKESGIKGWVFAIFTGILSHGPVYVWFPLLKDLRKQGMRTGLVAVFLYNRAIKIPLLPVMIFYFGIEFIIILLIWVVVASVIEGKVVEIIERSLTL